jgi:hypothetical protein
MRWRAAGKVIEAKIFLRDHFCDQDYLARMHREMFGDMKYRF